MSRHPGGIGGTIPPSASATSIPATKAAGGERALVLGDWKSAADLGLAALAGGCGGAAAQRGACVAIQALFELGRYVKARGALSLARPRPPFALSFSSLILFRFDEAHPALVSGFGGPMGVPPDALMLW